MHVLMVDGFVEPQPADLCRQVTASLERRGHTVDAFDLAACGFDDFMSEAERRAYHDAGHNIVSDAQRRSIEALRNHDALIICCPMTAGVVPAHVKGWLERTFLPGVAFNIRFGRLLPALLNLKRVALLAECDMAHDRRAHGRASCGRAIVRSVRLNARPTCRSSFGVIAPGEDPSATIERTVGRWPT